MINYYFLFNKVFMFYFLGEKAPTGVCFGTEEISIAYLNLNIYIASVNRV